MASTLAMRLWYSSALLLLALPAVNMQTTTIFTIQHEPQDWFKDVGPEKLAIVNMKLDGQSSDTALKYMSQFLHVGCFSAPKSITMDSEQDRNYDPEACVITCRDKMKTMPSSKIIAAVHKKLCGCVNEDQGGLAVFSESNDYAHDCNEPCKFYDNPICGGEPDYWGVFKEYDFQSLSSAGAYDPWRKIWYTVVVVLERTIDADLGGWPVTKKLPVKADDTYISPERYYLHAANKETGEGAFQYQSRLPGVVQGLQYDLDSSRLVGILSWAESGRVITMPKWTYYLFSMYINTTLPLRPNMTLLDKYPELFGKPLDLTYQLITGASAIVSKRNLDMFVYVMLKEQANLKESRHHIYFVSVPDGAHQLDSGRALDFRVVQLFSNEKYGDVSAFGYRYKKMVYLYLARVVYSFDTMRKEVKWMYESTRPEFLVDPLITENFWLYPGASTSEHLFNKSYSLLRNYTTTDPGATHMTNETGTLLMEVDIRVKKHKMMCNVEKGCYDSMNYTIPYAGIFNAEPRIPLSLAAPSLVYARFSIDGGNIKVLFDRATLKGATPVDIDNDIVPDDINYDTTQTGKFGCELLFDKESIALLGLTEDGTYCEWNSESEVTATLNSIELPDVEVGDQLYLKSDVVYTVPRMEAGEYSMAAAGGIQVSQPDPLIPPEVVLTGENIVDECSPVYFDAGDSRYTGGKAKYNWTLYNAIDTTMRADRVLNATRMQMLIDNLANTTRQNLPIFEMSSKDLEPAVIFEIKLVVTSRWGLNATETIKLNKLDYPAPMVQILGPLVVFTYRTQRVSLLATGRASNCPGIDRRLGYRWEETTGQLDMSTITDIVTTARSLVIPSFILEPAGTGDDVNTYNFTITCYVYTDSTRFSTAFATVKVRRSDVIAILGKEDRILTRGRPVIMDARESQDSDYPTTEGMTFKGTFLWWCVGPGQQPCYPENDLTILGGRQVDTTGQTQPDGNMTTCVTNINNKTVSAGRTFSMPIFEGYKYCSWARGVLMADSANFTEGNYTFTVEAMAIDGRTGRKAVVVQITRFDVPSLMLVLKNPDKKEKFPITSTLRFEGQVETELAPTANPLFYWNVLLYGLNNQWVQEEARQAETEGTIYAIDKYIFTDVSETLEISNQSRFKTLAATPNMLIFPNVLQASQMYKVRLNVLIQETGVRAYVDTSFATAGLPPRPGDFTVDPRNGTMDQKRLASATSWKADDLPLRYHFGYYVTLGSELIQMHWDTTPLPISSATLTLLPIGEPSTNYSLTVFVDVLSPFGAKTTFPIQIQSRPPANKTALINVMMTYVEQPGADPEQALANLTIILDVNNAPAPPPGTPMAPADEELMARIIAILQVVMPRAPQTKQVAIVQAQILQKVISAGYTNMNTMDRLEAMVLNAAAGGLFDVQDTALMKAAFYAIGGVLPNVDIPIIIPFPPEEFNGGRRLNGVNDRPQFRQSRMLEGERYSHEFGNADMSRLDIEHIMSTSFGRLEVNHMRPMNDALVISSCPTAFCDWDFLKCILDSEEDANVFIMYTCCSAPNKWTGCSDPPCWFKGTKCPMHFAEDDPNSPGNELARRLQPPQEQPSAKTGPELHWEWQWSEDLGYGSLIAAAAGKGGEGPVVRNFSNVSLQDRLSLELSLASLDKQRRLSAKNMSRGAESEESLLELEIDEAPMLRDVQKAIRMENRAKLQIVKADSRVEIMYAAMPPGEAIDKKAAYNKRKASWLEQVREAERSYSQIITRAAVLRDTICKQAIVQMTTSVEILRFDTPSFVLWMGKTRNLSDVRPSLVFPDKFIVPANTPDDATADNPLTAFAYVYIEYKKNIYGWSDSAPPGNKSTIITLNIMEANTKEIEIKNETDPIRVFADLSLFSSALCMFWDRFAPNTAGGAWSTRGVLNDGEGCLTTHLSDIGLFIDGRIPTTFSVDKAVSYYLEEVIDGPEGSAYNFSTAAVVGFLILLGTILALAGYIQDELIRERQRMGKASASHYLDGDGLSAPLSVDDAIAYDHIADRHLFLVFTLWKVVLRDHALLGVFHYNTAFTRPQRILCLGVMATSVLAVNAMIYGVPREFVSDDQWIPSGVISGLLSFPMFVCCIFMFSARPTQQRKRLIKRRTNNAEIEAIAQVRRDIEHESSKLYPKTPQYPGQLALPEYPVQHAHVGRTTLLALPSPVPAQPSVPPPGMISLPPPPQGVQLPVAGMYPALAGLPTLPPLPALKPGPGLPALPPPPKYQPPMSRLSRAGLPEPGTRMLPPPPAPPPQDGPRMAGIADGDANSRSNSLGPANALMPPPPGFGDTEATSLPSALAPQGTHGAPPPAPDVDVASDMVRRDLQNDGLHGMHQPVPRLPELSAAPPEGGPPMSDGYLPDMPGAGGFCTPRTPHSMQPNEMVGFMPDAPMMPPPLAPPIQGISGTGIVNRGEPAAVLPPPAFMPGLQPPPPPGSLGLPPLPGLPPMLPIRPPMGFGLAPGVPAGLPPGMIPPPSVMMMRGDAIMGPGMAAPQPPPPPPPKEDDAVFLRRARLHYMERAAKMQQEMMIDHGQEAPRDIPNYMYTIMALCPYIACATSICCHLEVTLAYSMKFQRIAEKYWYYSTVIGLVIVLVILELMRSAVMTIVELRKFEIRRRLAGGDFNRSRIRKQTASSRDPLHPHRDKKKPAVPSVPPRKPPPPPGRPPPPPREMPLGPPPKQIDEAIFDRPGFLPELEGNSGSFIRTPGGAGLPVGAPPPPKGKAPGFGPMSMGKPPPGIPPLQGMPGMGTPGRGGMSGAAGGSLMPGKLRSGGATPPLGFTPGNMTPPGMPGAMGQSFGSGTMPLGQTPPPPPLPAGRAGMPPPSPSGSLSSHMSKSLSEKMAANRAGAPPPPPGATRGPTPPTSHRSGGSGRGAKPPPGQPPPSQSTLERNRSAKRGQ